MVKIRLEVVDHRLVGFVVHEESVYPSKHGYVAGSIRIGRYPAIP